MRTLLLGLLFATITGCSSWGFPGVYRINVEQGNIITQEMVDQLKPGMDQRQVRYILGTPLVEDPFNPNRWEYLYMLRNGNNTLREERLSVHFENNALTHFDTTLVPTEEPVPTEANPKEEETYYPPD